MAVCTKFYVQENYERLARNSCLSTDLNSRVIKPILRVLELRALRKHDVVLLPAPTNDLRLNIHIPATLDSDDHVPIARFRPRSRSLRIQPRVILRHIPRSRLTRRVGDDLQDPADVPVPVDGVVALGADDVYPERVALPVHEQRDERRQVQEIRWLVQGAVRRYGPPRGGDYAAREDDWVGERGAGEFAVDQEAELAEGPVAVGRVGWEGGEVGVGGVVVPEFFLGVSGGVELCVDLDGAAGQCDVCLTQELLFRKMSISSNSMTCREDGWDRSVVRASIRHRRYRNDGVRMPSGRVFPARLIERRVHLSRILPGQPILPDNIIQLEDERPVLGKKRQVLRHIFHIGPYDPARGRFRSRRPPY